METRRVICYNMLVIEIKDVGSLKKIISLIMCILLIVGIFGGCSSDDPVVLFFAVDKKAGSFDPQIVSDTTASLVVRNCFEGLLRKDENGGIVNGVAKDWKVSSDGLTYTFYLRQDAQWHLTSNAQKQLEGKLPEDFDLSVTAYDFRFALRRACDPATGAHNAYMLYNIENAPEIAKGTKAPEELGVTVKDKYTLEIRLSQPQSNFPEVLTEPQCMPCNETFFEACAGRYGTLIAFSLSNGPFYLSRFDDESYRINKASDYIGEVDAVPDYVWLYVVTDTDKLIEVLETDDYSGAVISKDVYSKLTVGKNMTVTETANTVRGFVMNLSDSVMGEVNIRKALAAATDTQAVAKNLGGVYTASLVPPSCAPDGAVAHPEPYSEEKAKIYLDSGLEKLEKTSVDITVLCEAESESAVRRVMQEWQRILGMRVNFSVKTGTAAEVRSAVDSKNYQIALYTLSAKADNPYEFFGSFTANSPYNLTGFDGAGMEELIAKLHSGTDNTFISVFSSVESKLSGASLFIPVCTENTYFVCTKNVRGVIYFSSADKLYFHKATNVK